MWSSPTHLPALDINVQSCYIKKGGNPLKGVTCTCHHILHLCKTCTCQEKQTCLCQSQLPLVVAVRDHGSGGDARLWHTYAHKKQAQRFDREKNYPNRLPKSKECSQCGIVWHWGWHQRGTQSKTTRILGASLKCLLLSVVPVKTSQSGNVWHAEKRKMQTLWPTENILGSITERSAVWTSWQSQAK